jgi:rod shape-determining protein MreB
MRNGVIADYVITEAMLRYFINKVRGWLRILHPEVMVCVPAGVTSVEQRAVHDATLQAGAKTAYLIQEPLAAALGAKIPIHLPSGNMVVDIGGGTTEAAVISLNGIVVANSVRVGGDKLDEAIASYIKRKYSLMIGERTAEEVKIAIGSALPLEEETTCEVRGRDQVGGLPKTITIKSTEVRESISEPLSQIVAAVRWVLEQTPPELASDVIDKGIIISGGGALLRNVDRLLTLETGVPCHVADNPMECVAIGAGLALERLELLRRNLPVVEA